MDTLTAKQLLPYPGCSQSSILQRRLVQWGAQLGPTRHEKADTEREEALDRSYGLEQDLSCERGLAGLRCSRILW